MDIFKKAGFIVIFLVVSSSLSFAQTVIDTIKISNASDIAINPETNRIYVAGNDSLRFKSFVSVIDGDTNEIIETIDIDGRSSLDISINTLSNTIYVSNTHILSTLRPFDSVNFITIIDGDTNDIIDIIGLSKIDPRGIILNQKTNKIYIPGAKELNVKKMVIYVIDGETNEVIQTIDLQEGNIGYAAINQETNRIYVEEFLHDRSGDRKVNIAVIDGETDTLIDTIELGDITIGRLAVNEVTNKIYLAEIKNFLSENINDLMSVINVIDGATNEVIDVIELDSTVIQPVDVNPESNKIYAGTLKIDQIGFASEFVEIVDGENNDIIGDVDVGDRALPDSWPFDIAVNLATNRIYTSIIGGLVQVAQDE